MRCYQQGRIAGSFGLGDYLSGRRTDARIVVYAARLLRTYVS